MPQQTSVTLAVLLTLSLAANRAETAERPSYAAEGKITLSYHQVDGSSEHLEVFYPNLQAIEFPRQ